MAPRRCPLAHLHAHTPLASDLLCVPLRALPNKARPAALPCLKRHPSGGHGGLSIAKRAKRQPACLPAQLSPSNTPHTHTHTRLPCLLPCARAQNPPGAYAGRKALSRAFRSRFLELHVEDIPDGELAEILERRCAVPASYAARLVRAALGSAVLRYT